MADANKNVVKKSNGLINFFKETGLELKKVVWPTKKQLFVNTTIVIIASLVTSIFVACVDFGLIQVVDRLLFMK